MYNLECKYDTRSSFYGKAKIEEINNKNINDKILYSYGKEVARDSIIELMEILSKKSISYGELSYYQELITKLGKKFGLIKELKENGIL